MLITFDEAIRPGLLGFRSRMSCAKACWSWSGPPILGDVDWRFGREALGRRSELGVGFGLGLGVGFRGVGLGLGIGFEPDAVLALALALEA